MGHGHTHTPDIDFGEHAVYLRHGDLLWSQVTTRIAAELPVPSGATVADIGCGTGEMTLLLAERVGDGGQVLAVDRSAVLLDKVRERAEEAGLAGRVVPVQADLTALPGALPGPVDLLWAGHVVHHAGDQAATVKALAAALAPGGTLAVAEGGLPMRCLPWDAGVGRPGLQVRLEVAHDAWFGAMRAGLPGSVRESRGWPALLRSAQLVEVTTKAWLLHHPAPLDPAMRQAAINGLASRVELAEQWLDDEDRAAWSRLLDGADPNWLGHRDDLELIAAKTVHLGRAPHAKPVGMPRDGGPRGNAQRFRGGEVPPTDS
jgi:SAM-dependent methyltransferase